MKILTLQFTAEICLLDLWSKYTDPTKIDLSNAFVCNLQDKLWE